MLPRAARDTCQACICVFGGQATSSLLSSAAVDETEFRRSQPAALGSHCRAILLHNMQPCTQVELLRLRYSCGYSRTRTVQKTKNSSLHLGASFIMHGAGVLACMGPEATTSLEMEEAPAA
jgi:hypothetical protein